jgi:exodeoxyribonuclease X
VSETGTDHMAQIIRVIDYETTGFPEEDGSEVIELGRVDVDLQSMTVGNLWRSFALPAGPIPPEVKAVHHITEGDLAGAPSLSNLWTAFWEDCSSNDIVAAHNAKFERHFHPGDGRAWIDTYKCALVIWPDAPAHNNQTLRYWLDLDSSPAFSREFAMPPHRALPDAYVTAHILVRMLAERSVSDLLSVSDKPALLNKVSFGKHRGMKFSDVPIDYLQWICDKSDMNGDVKFTAAHWIQRRKL